MLPGQQSRTAQYMALFRAMENRRPAAKRLCTDPFAEAFLDGPLRAASIASGLPLIGRLIPWLLDRRVPGPRPSAVARTRFIDDAVCRAVERGCRQVVILGAGYDSRPYRLPELSTARVFEVDHPNTQTVKRDLITRQLGSIPEHVRLVPVDLDREPLAAGLEAAGLAVAARTYFIWEGVLSYLTLQAVEATADWMHAVSGPASGLVLTYVHAGLLDGTQVFPFAEPWARSVRRAGEPFVLGFTPSALGAFLAERGWRVLDDLSTAEALTRYGQSAARVPAFYRIATAERLKVQNRE